MLPNHKAYKHQDMANKKQIRLIPRNNSVTPSINRNIDFSYKLGAKPDGHIKKIKMPMVIQISPQPSTGREAFTYNVKFNMSRTKSIVSEDVETHFRQMEVLTYPSLVGLPDANGQPIHCSGEVTFNVTIAGRTTTSVHGSLATSRGDS